MLNNYCQCPSCGSMYSKISQEDAKELVNKHKKFFNLLLTEQRMAYQGKFQLMDQFKYCLCCGTTSDEFEEATDPEFTPLMRINPIIFEKRVDS